MAKIPLNVSLSNDLSECCSSSNKIDALSNNGKSSRRLCNNSRPKLDKNCAICGDFAVGFNFGAIACESCKAFFRRNALRPAMPTCLFSGDCLIQVKTRRFCSPCRLQKCFSIGMRTSCIMDEDAKKERHLKILMNRQRRTKNKDCLQNHKETFPVCLGLSTDQSHVQYTFSTSSTKNNTDQLSSFNDKQAWSDPSYAFVSANEDNSYIHSMMPTYTSWIESNQEWQTEKTPNGHSKYLPGSSLDQVHTDDPPKISFVKSGPYTCLENLQCPESVNSYTTGPNLNNKPLIERWSNYPPVNSFVPSMSATRAFSNAEVNYTLKSSELSDAQRISNYHQKQAHECSGIKNVLDGHIWTSEHIESSNKECISLCSSAKRSELARLLSKAEWTALNDLRRAYETSFSCSAADNTPGTNSTLTLSSLVNTSGFLVRKLINFAKKLADFSVLSQESQISLLKGVVLNALFIRSASHYDVEKDVWVTPTGDIPTGILKIATGLDRLYEEHALYCKNFCNLVQKDSFLVALMQALCLFAPDRPLLTDRQSVSSIYDRYILLLKHYLEARHGFTRGRILLATVLTNLAELQALTDEYGTVLMLVDPSKVDPLILEVFNLSSTPSPPTPPKATDTSETRVSPEQNKTTAYQTIVETRQATHPTEQRSQFIAEAC